MKMHVFKKNSFLDFWHGIALQLQDDDPIDTTASEHVCIANTREKTHDFVLMA